MTRYFKVTHRAGAFQDDIYYPPAQDGGDISQSIVPLDLPKGAKPPMWGVECDKDGNEFDVPAVVESVEDKLSAQLANKIASKAGEPPAAPPAADKETEQRKATILAALELLEHDNKDHWTARNDPSTDAVKAITGLEVTRAELDAIAPDFKRKV